MKTTTYIYGLVNVDTDVVGYIGKSNNPKKRYYGHMGETKRGKKSSKCEWVRGLDKPPKLIILEECDMSLWTKREIFWIEKLNPKGNHNYRQKSKIVIQYDLDGNFIKEYESINESSRQSGVALGNISNVCNEKLRQSNGFIWRIKGRKYKKKKKSPIRSQKRKLSQYDLDGNFIESFNSINECVKITGFARTSISNCCFFNLEKLKSSSCGYKWKFDEDIKYI